MRLPLALFLVLLAAGPARALDALDRTGPAAAALLRADPARTGYVRRDAAEASFAAAAAESEARARMTWASLAAICDASPGSPGVSARDVDDGIGRQLLRADENGDGAVDAIEARAYVAARRDPVSRQAAALALSIAEGGVGMPIDRLAWVAYANGRAESDEPAITAGGLIETERRAWQSHALWLDAAFRLRADARGWLRLDAVLR